MPLLKSQTPSSPRLSRAFQANAARRSFVRAISSAAAYSYSLYWTFFRVKPMPSSVIIQSASFAQDPGSESGLEDLLIQVKTLLRWWSLAKSSAAAYMYSPELAFLIRMRESEPSTFSRCHMVSRGAGFSQPYNKKAMCAIKLLLNHLACCCVQSGGSEQNLDSP